jgi:hypothetical protein
MSSKSQRSGAGLGAGKEQLLFSFKPSFVRSLSDCWEDALTSDYMEIPQRDAHNLAAFSQGVYVRERRETERERERERENERESEFMTFAIF